MVATWNVVLVTSSPRDGGTAARCGAIPRRRKSALRETMALLGKQSSEAEGKHELNNRHQFRKLACEDTSTSLPISDVQLQGVCACE